MVETTKGMLWDQQVLVCVGYQLKDHPTHSIQQHITLHLLLWPRGIHHVYPITP